VLLPLQLAVHVESLAVHGLGFAQIALPVQRGGEVQEALGDIGMLRAVEAAPPQLAPFFAGVSAADNCPGVSITNDAPSFFALGATNVTFTARDSGGASASCSSVVTVRDTRPPHVTVAVQPDVLWPPSHQLVDIIAAVTATDICDPSPTYALASISSNEPDNGLGDGDMPVDIQGYLLGTPDTAFRLRAERSGLGDGRLYTVVYTASDQSGNQAAGNAIVTVPHDR
jgi:hypothetical protein